MFRYLFNICHSLITTNGFFGRIFTFELAKKCKTIAETENHRNSSHI